MYVLPLTTLASVSDQEIGAAVVAKEMLGNAGEFFILLLIIISIFGSLNAVLLSHSRIYYRMAQEKFFFPAAAKVHKRFHTPYISLFMMSAWSCLCWFFPVPSICLVTL